MDALLKARANMYLRNRGGFTALHLACQNGHNQTCRLLLLAGCSPDIRNSVSGYRQRGHGQQGAVEWGLGVGNDAG